MAALMPGADGNLNLVKDKEELVPHVKEEKVLVPKDRSGRDRETTYINIPIPSVDGGHGKFGSIPACARV